jgi:peptide/nickel transport system ATP-binding protein
MTPLLEVSGLTVGFPTRGGAVVLAADDVSFAVEPRQTLGLVGESGCGKSVTLRALLGLVPFPGQVVDGSVRLEGRELLGLRPGEWESVRGDRAGMVFQDPMASLDPLFTVGDQLVELLRAKRGLRRAAARARAAELLDRVEIPDPKSKLRSYPHELSGGMRQRVMIALAIATEPALLLADEPTTALDVTVQDQVLALLRTLQEELDLAVLLVSHDLGVIGQVCDQVAVMYAGRIVERGSVEDVLDRPSHPYTEGLAACVAQLALGSRHDGRRLSTLEGQPPALADLPPGCSFSPRCSLHQGDCDSFDMALRVGPDAHATACLVRQRQGSAGPVGEVIGGDA